MPVSPTSTMQAVRCPHRIKSGSPETHPQTVPPDTLPFTVCAPSEARPVPDSGRSPAMPPCRAEGAISAPLPRCHSDRWLEVPHLHESCKSVFALQHAGFPVSAAAPLPIAVQTFDALLWYPAAVQHIHVWHPTFVLTVRCAFLRQPPKCYALP